ncbi:MAG: PD-(D/E)XK nuclease family protein [Clostridiales bacterium]|nr:PD-(D/E)XK nuclease family protein [Clostridiales bacterium]
MAFHLLYGEHPVSLIDTCLSRICDEAVKWPTRRGYIIVPEKMKAEVERRYIEILQEKKGGKGNDAAFMMIDVVSFSRFAFRVLSEAGGMGGKALNPAGRTILIHRILSENKQEFPVLGSFAERVGFISEIDEVLGDFYRYGVSGSMLEEMDLEGESPLTVGKIRDFGHLLTKMDALREELGFAPERDSMKRLDEVLRLFREDAPETKTWPLKRLAFLRDASCWILGFGETRNFTPEEYNIVTDLAAVASKVTLTCVAASDEPEEMGDDIGHFGEKTIRSILKEFVPESSEKAGPSENRVPALSVLSSDYASRSCARREDLDLPVEIKVFHQISDELEYVAARIKEAVQFKGLNYRDVTVVMCDLEKYGTSLHAAFSKYGLDAFVDEEQPLMGTIWMQYLTSILDISSFRWDISSVISYLKSGFVTVDMETVQRFENFCLAHGIRNKKKMLACENFVSTVAEKQVVKEILPVLLKTADEIGCVEKAKTCKERAIALHNMIFDKRQHVEYLVDEWQKAGNQQAALALALSYNYSDEALNTMANDLGDFPISLVNFRDALLSALESKMLAAIPSYVDQITITKASSAYRRSCRMMFIVGSERKNFPFTSPSEGYLKNKERTILSEKLSIDFPNHAKDQAYSDFFTAYALLDAPTDRLIFTIQNSVEPSSVITFLKDQYPKVIPEILDHLSLRDPRILLKEKMEDYLRDVLSRPAPEEPDPEYDEAVYIWKTYFSSSDLSFDDKADTSLQIPKDLMDQRYHDKLLMSVSSVESYLYCPYHYFCEKVLKIDERQVQKVQPTEMGSLAHTVMEKALTEFRDEYNRTPDDEKQYVLEKFRKKDKLAWSRDILRDAQEQKRYAYCDDPALKMAADTKLLAGVKETLDMIFNKLDPEKSMPSHFEWEFGSDDIPGYDLPLSDGRVVTFTGKIDRIDVNKEENRFNILDYKTGNKKIEFDMLYSGASVQLPAYMYVYSSRHPEMEPDGISYIHVARVKTRCKGMDESLDPDTVAKDHAKAVSETFGPSGYALSADPSEMKKMGEFALAHVREKCEKLYSGHFDAKPAKLKKKPLMKCMDCEYNQICNGIAESPDYNYLPTMAPVKSEDGKDLKSSALFFANIKREEE